MGLRGNAAPGHKYWILCQLLPLDCQHHPKSLRTWCRARRQADATARVRDSRSLISTDPPYYDNIGYSDLSDFFYVWLRRSLRAIYPELLSTMLVPKAEELVANPYRHGGKDGAKEFFEDGFRRSFARARAIGAARLPDHGLLRLQAVRDHEGGEASTGWETLLDGMIGSGWSDNRDMADAKRAG